MTIFILNSTTISIKVGDSCNDEKRMKPLIELHVELIYFK